MKKRWCSIVFCMLPMKKWWLSIVFCMLPMQKWWFSIVVCMFTHAKMVIFHSCLYVYQRVSPTFLHPWHRSITPSPSLKGSDESVEAPRASPLVLHDEPLRGAAVEQFQDLVNGFMVSLYIYIYIYLSLEYHLIPWNVKWDIIGGDIMEYNLMEYNEI